MAKKVPVLIISSIEGHKSISTAISDFLKTKKVKSYTYIYPDPILDVYKVFYQHAPQTVKAFYHLSHNLAFQKLMREYALNLYKRKVEKLISQYQPKVVVSTYFSFNPAIEKQISTMDESTRPVFFNIFTDPRTYIPLLLSDTGVNFVFDEYQKRLCKKQNADAETVVAGWFTRSSFTPTKSKSAVRKKLGVQSQSLVYAITGGSEGQNSIFSLTQKIFEEISKRSSSQHLHIFIVCGGNTKLFEKASVLSKSLSNESVTVTALGFVTNIHEYFQAADLVIGKAGPNTLFESVATHTPFFATTHIHGHEDGNLDIIKKYKVGYVNEQTGKAAKKLAQLACNPSELESKRKHVVSLAKYLEKTKDVFWDRIKDYV